VELLLAGAQHDFPVLVGEQVVGVLPRQTLVAALAAQGPETPVQSVMLPAAAPVAAQSPLSEAFRRMNDEEVNLLPVVEDDHLVGLLTAENLGEFLMIQNALHSLAPRPRPGKPGEVVAPGA
jgi:CBS domain-containing protein